MRYGSAYGHTARSRIRRYACSDNSLRLSFLRRLHPLTTVNTELVVTLLQLYVKYQYQVLTRQTITTDLDAAFTSNTAFCGYVS